MKRSWVIWTVALIAIGGLGLSAVVIDIHREKTQTAHHKAKYGKGADEYVQQYFEWSTLPPDERIENPWGHGRYGGPDMREKLIHGQRDRLKADLADLAAGATTPPMVADVLYGPDWHQQVDDYRRRCDLRDGIALTSTIIVLAGLIICIGMAAHHSLRPTLAQPQNDTDDQPPETAPKPEPANSDNDLQTCGDLVSEIIKSAPKEMPAGSPGDSPAPSIGVKGEKIGYFRNFGPPSRGDRTAELKNTLRSQAAGFKTTESPAATGGGLGTLMSSAPVASELTELTQEVSAIREFAAQQQDRVRQLQDGYDWGIIKRFCLRIIRCIDNLDERMQALPPDGPDMQALMDVRDELVFSLESSGVEQFEPPLKSDYKGLEKSSEAVKSREPAPAPELVGKIAAVIRPGYRYAVSEEDVKIVRCAQVKLYGESTIASEDANNE